MREGSLERRFAGRFFFSAIYATKLEATGVEHQIEKNKVFAVQLGAAEIASHL